jgi:uncharacterized membrane protein
VDPGISLSLSCPDCATLMPETAGFCPGCGRAMRAAPPAREKIGRLPENVAGGLAYFTFIPAIIFLSRAPYSKNHFVRYHSIQCLLLWVATLVLAAALRLAGIVLLFIPVAGPLLMVVISGVLAIAAFLLWLVLAVKAFQGEKFDLPILGDVAEHYAGPSSI